MLNDNKKHADKPGHAPSKSKGGRPPAKDLGPRSQRLQEVALEVFLEFGFEKTKLSEIARRANASKETLYSRYQSKEELFLAVTKTVIELPNPLFDELKQNRGLTLENSLKEFVFRWLTASMQEDRQALNRLIFCETRRFPDLGQLFWDARHVRHQVKLADFLRTEIAQGRLRDGDAHLMACQFLDLAFVELIIKVLLGVLRPMTATERRQRAELAVGTFMRLYGPVVAS